MIATGIATVIARPAASRTLRSRTSRPITEGPTPFEPGMPTGRGSIRSSLLGFRDFGAEAIEKRLLGRERRMLRQQRVRDLVGLEQQILPLIGRGGVREAPEVTLGAVDVAIREAHDGQPASLPRVLLRIAPLALFVGGERLAVSSGEEQRVAQVVVAEHERRVDVDDAGERRLGFVEPSELARDDADVVEDGEAARIVGQRLTEGLQRRGRIAELAERRAEIAERRRERRHQIGGALEGVAGAREIVVDQRQLAALVVNRLPVGRQRRGAIERGTRAVAVTVLAARALERELRDLAVRIE